MPGKADHPLSSLPPSPHALVINKHPRLEIRCPTEETVSRSHGTVGALLSVVLASPKLEDQDSRCEAGASGESVQATAGHALQSRTDVHQVDVWQSLQDASRRLEVHELPQYSQATLLEGDATAVAQAADPSSKRAQHLRKQTVTGWTDHHGSQVDAEALQEVQQLAHDVLRWTVPAALEEGSGDPVSLSDDVTTVRLESLLR